MDLQGFIQLLGEERGLAAWERQEERREREREEERKQREREEERKERERQEERKEREEERRVELARIEAKQEEHRVEIARIEERARRMDLELETVRLRILELESASQHELQSTTQDLSGLGLNNREDTIKTRLHQGSASDFVASAADETALDGVGVTFSTAWTSGTALFADLFPCDQWDSAEEVAAMEALSHTIMNTPGMDIVHETPTKPGKATATNLLVQANHLDPLSLFFAFNTTTKHKKSLKKLGCAIGVVTERSWPDAWFTKCFKKHTCGKWAGGPGGEEFPGGIFPLSPPPPPPPPAPTDTLVCGCASATRTAGLFEVKHSTDAPDEGLRQAFAECTNVALALRQWGVPASRIVVPCVASNGQLIKFAAVRMLEPSFPYLVVCTRTLDIADEADRRTAARCLLRLRSWCSRTLEVTHSEPPPGMELSTRRYHLKELHRVFQVVPHWPHTLRHHFSVLRALRCAESAAPFVVFPLTLRLHATFPLSTLVYPNLALDGYRIGLPDAEALCAEVVAELRTAVAAVHAAGVVHLDLYPSNFMWRRGEQERAVRVKIIDWDAAHLKDSVLTEHTQRRLHAAGRHRVALLRLAATDSRLHRADPAWDTSLLEVLESNLTCNALKSVHKKVLDSAFWELVAAAAAAAAPVVNTTNTGSPL